MKPILTSLALLLGGAAALGLAGCSAGASTSSDRLSIVRSLPYLEPQSTPIQWSGQPVVVEFWATWCPPCVESVPHLVELDERLRSEGLVLVGVHAARGANDEAGVRRFVEAHDVEYAIALDQDGAAGRAFGVSGIPHAFVFARDGSIAWQGHPLDPAFTEAVERVVRG